MIIYLVKSTILLALLLGVYKLFLENEKMHTFNRFFLLAALVLGLTAPLVQINVSPDATIAGLEISKVESTVNAPSEFVARTIEPVIEAAPVASQTSPGTEEAVASQQSEVPLLSRKQILGGVYILVTLFLLIRFGAGIYQLLAKVKHGTTSSFNNSTLVLLDEKIIPQSFFKWIFLNKSDFESDKINPEILEHELTHIRQKHSLDVLFIELIKTLFWFNPILYFYKHAIQLNHEFLADEGAINGSDDIQNYQSILLTFASKAASEKITSRFDFPLTKKRLMMMAKHFSSFRSSAKSILTVCFVSFLSFVFCTQTEIDSDELYTNVQLKLISLPYEQIQDSGGYYDSRMVDTDGNLFTGTQNWYFKKDEQLFLSITFKEGHRVKKQTFRRTGKELYRVEIEYDFETGEQISMHSFDDGILSIESFASSPEDHGLDVYREWHPSGRLKFEMTSYSEEDRPMVYEGLMTLYDEQGNILQRELYKDGELVEKIK